MSETVSDRSAKPRPPQPLAVVAGGSAGLGRVVAAKLVERGYHVILVARDAARLEQTRAELLASGPAGASVTSVIADLTSEADLRGLAVRVGEIAPRLDVLVNVAGSSDRGLAAELTRDRLIELVDQNVTTAILCSRHLLPMIAAAGGVIVNVGSLASKVGARYLGGYVAAKHALAGWTQQLRLELRPRGVHVALVCPGPIRRDDAGRRYAERLDAGLPEQASAPGGGTRVRGLAPERVAVAVIRCIDRRCPEIILPGYLRLLVALGHAFPRLGDWLLIRMTGRGDKR